MFDSMRQDASNSGMALAAAWAVCVGPILSVLDAQDGSDCLTRIRHLAGEAWITSDPDMGYALISRSVLDGYARMGFALVEGTLAASDPTRIFSLN